MSNFEKFTKNLAPIGRVMIAIMFVMSGLSKISAFSGTQGYMESQGVPGMLLPLVIFVEIVGGVAVILGWQTRIMSAALAGFCVVSAVLFHANFADQTQMIMFMKNIAIAGGFLFLVANGSGPWAIDRR